MATQPTPLDAAATRGTIEEKRARLERARAEQLRRRQEAEDQLRAEEEELERELKAEAERERREQRMQDEGVGAAASKKKQERKDSAPKKIQEHKPRAVKGAVVQRDKGKRKETYKSREIIEHSDVEEMAQAAAGSKRPRESAQDSDLNGVGTSKDEKPRKKARVGVPNISCTNCEVAGEICEPNANTGRRRFACKRCMQRKIKCHYELTTDGIIESTESRPNATTHGAAGSADNHSAQVQTQYFERIIQELSASNVLLQALLSQVSLSTVAVTDLSLTVNADISRRHARQIFPIGEGDWAYDFYSEYEDSEGEDDSEPEDSVSDGGIDDIAAGNPIQYVDIEGFISSAAADRAGGGRFEDGFNVYEEDGAQWLLERRRAARLVSFQRDAQLDIVTSRHLRQMGKFWTRVENFEFRHLDEESFTDDSEVSGDDSTMEQSISGVSGDA